MQWLITKYLISAGAVVVISEVAKRSGKLGGLLAALPVITLLSMVWMYIEQTPEAEIANQASFTFWYVIPTLPMFLVFPLLLARFGFWTSMGLSVVLTIACFFLLSLAVKPLGIELV
jgi:uncharacterized membrane protein YdbT with pleckstrin-like domain